MLNSYASWYRRLRTREFATDRALESVLAADEFSQVDERDRVTRALGALPQRQRAVIVLRYYEDLSEIEIASAMGTSVGTVKSHAARAMRRLAAELNVGDASTTTSKGELHD